MNKYLWFVCIGIFVFVTAFVLALDSTESRRVSFSNQDFAINNEANEFVDNSGTNIHFADSKLQNKGIANNNSAVKFSSSKVGMTTSNTNVTNSSTVENNDVKIKDNSSYSTQKTEYEPYSSSYGSQNSKVDNKDVIKYKNVDSEALDVTMEKIKNVSTKPVDYHNKPFRQMNKYAYKNIDWSTWKSNFVNRILDDSANIRSLDSYSDGSWFYYSFDVSKEGEISNISIKSIYLDNVDKAKIKELIKSYEYQEITVFPANTKREKAHISAVMLLTTEDTQHSNPADFNDFERVRIPY